MREVTGSSSNTRNTTGASVSLATSTGGGLARKVRPKIGGVNKKKRAKTIGAGLK
jgi:hypothetical protein